jgi:hypothetical protein
MRHRQRGWHNEMGGPHLPRRTSAGSARIAFGLIVITTLLALVVAVASPQSDVPGHPEREAGFPALEQAGAWGPWHCHHYNRHRWSGTVNHHSNFDYGYRAGGRHYHQYKEFDTGSRDRFHGYVDRDCTGVRH